MCHTFSKAIYAFVIVIYKLLYEEQLLLGLLYTHFFIHMPVPMFVHQADFICDCFWAIAYWLNWWVVPNFHSWLTRSFGPCSSRYFYRALWRLWFVFLCFHFATWVYNSIDHPSLGQCPMHSALWYCTILFDIVVNLALLSCSGFCLFALYWHRLLLFFSVIFLNFFFFLCIVFSLCHTAHSDCRLRPERWRGILSTLSILKLDNTHVKCVCLFRQSNS